VARVSKYWVWAPAKPKKVPDFLKRQVSAKANSLVEESLKPEHVKPPPKNPKFNYIVDIYTKWRGRFFCFLGKYATPSADRIAPFFEIGFARLEYAGKDRFHLAYFRHTGEWWQIRSDLSLDEALNCIKDGGSFHP